jgi:putative MATE family efflux protein
MLNIAVPQVLGNLLHTLVIYTDFLMVSKLSAQAIVAVGIGMQIWGLFYASMSLIYIGQNTLMSRFIGAKSYLKASMLLSSLLIFVMLLSIPMVLFWQNFGIQVFEIFDADPKVLELGKSYLMILFIAIPLEYVNSIFFTAMVANGDAKTPMYITLGTVFLNILLDYMLIFGHFGFEPMGVEGAAIATLGTILFEYVVYVVLYLKGKTGYQPMRHFSFQLIKRVLRIGFPAMIDRLLGSGAMLFFTVMVLTLGTTISAGFQLGFRIEGLAFMPGFGFAMAASVLMGQGLGAKNPDNSYKDVLLALRYGASVMFAVSILFIFAPEYLVSFFTKEEEVIKEASYYLIVVGITQIPLAIAFILNGALKGAGDTKRVFRINILTTWIFRLLPGMISVYGFGSIYGIYFGLVADPLAKAVIYWRVFKKGEWRRLRV